MHTDHFSGTAGKKGDSKPRARAKSSAKPKTLSLKQQQSATAQSIDMSTLIATAAYFHAERRGFEPGHELDDWLAAEQQVRTKYQS